MKNKIVYFDHSATMPIHPEVAKEVFEVSKTYIGNPNSSHVLGERAAAEINKATSTIARALRVENEEVIFVSSASEANNTVINTMREKYRNQGRHIITTMVEHPSMVAPLAKLQKEGFVIDTLSINANGRIDYEELLYLLSFDPVLVTVIAVESETGIIFEVDKIAEFVKANSNALFHTDMTQAFMKIGICLDHVDYATISAHKIGGPKGIGALIKKKNGFLFPLIYGGHSTTKYRASTPATELIAGFAKSVQVMDMLKKKETNLINLNQWIIREMISRNFLLNRAELSSPYILNFSHLSIRSSQFQTKMAQKGAFFSLRSACSSEEGFSQSVLSLTQSMERAEHCFRLSFSSENTLEEAKQFIRWVDEFLEVYQ